VNPMKQNKRTQQKERSHERIVEVAARQFREGGMTGAGVQRIMEEAGLTHGGFYSHFGSKDDLVAEALVAAMTAARGRLLADLEGLPEAERFQRLVTRYLSRTHRDAPGTGCPLPSMCAEISRAPDTVRRAFGDELRQTIEQAEATLAGVEGEEAHVRAVGAFALCVGGLLLARAVDDATLSDDILKSCRQFAADAVERGDL